jgi:hypothetical protein
MKVIIISNDKKTINKIKTIYPEVEVQVVGVMKKACKEVLNDLNERWIK